MKKQVVLFMFIVATSTLLAGVIDPPNNPDKVEVDGICYYLVGDSAKVTSHTTGFYNDTITIPSSITYLSKIYRVISVENEAFYINNGLKVVNLPSSIAHITYVTFYGCSSLIEINVDSANSHYASIDGVLFNFAKDTLIKYPAGNERTSYHVPDGVTTIGNEALMSGNSLTTISFCESLTTIGEGAGSSFITSITCYATTPPTCSSFLSLYFINKSIPLYVPSESVGLYKAADQWKDFTNIQAIPTRLESIHHESNITSRKWMKEGQLMIQHYNRTYNILGGDIR